MWKGHKIQKKSCVSFWHYLQGISLWNVSFKLTLTDRNMQVRLCLKASVYSWDYVIWVSFTSYQKSHISWPQPQHQFSWFCSFFFQNAKLKYFGPPIIEFKNQDDSEVLNSNFTGLRNHCSLIDLSGLCNLIGLNSLYSLIFSKNFLIPMVWSSMASKWPVLVIFCGMVHQKSKLSLIYGTISVGGCWGQPMLLFWKLVDETQMP